MNIETLNKYKKQGWLKSQSHPYLPLIIWNYTQATQFEKKWDEITLMCRGLVTDTEGNIVARPLNKFFNYEELLSTNSVPKGPYIVYEKLDGSYIQVFTYNGEMVISSRGSFTSDQVSMTEEVIEETWGKLERELILRRSNINFIFELIHPQNRIVVDYNNKKKLVLLSAVRKDGKEILPDLFYATFNTPESYTFENEADYSSIKNSIPDDKEGYVLLFDSGERMKIKGEEYFRLHKIVTRTSSKDIWKALIEGKSMREFVEHVPDEFMKWFYQKVGEYVTKYKIIEEECIEFTRYISKTYVAKDIEGDLYVNKRLASGEVEKHRYRGVIWAMIDGKSYDKLIWNLITPEFEKAFSV